MSCKLWTKKNYENIHNLDRIVHLIIYIALLHTIKVDKNVNISYFIIDFPILMFYYRHLSEGLPGM